MAGLGVNVAASTVWEILKASGIGPARQSGPNWSQFLRSQAEAILACDFFTADLLDGTQAHVLAVIEHATRRIRILGVTLHPTGQRTAQQARNLLMDLGEEAEQVKFMIRDRGSNFTVAFDAVLADASIRTVLCNVRAPRMNAITERWIGGCRRELLDRTLIWNQAHLHQMLRQYEAHHNQHRPHRSLHGAAPLKPLPEAADLHHYSVRKRARVGGLINEYHLVAWHGRGFRHAQVNDAACDPMPARPRGSTATPCGCHQDSRAGHAWHQRWRGRRGGRALVRRAGPPRGDPANLRQIYVDRGGHCSFTAAEEIVALRSLQDRLDTHRWPRLDPAALNARALSVGPTYQQVFDWVSSPATVTPAFVTRPSAPGPAAQPIRPGQEAPGRVGPLLSAELPRRD
jgi:hypothetical protein